MSKAASFDPSRRLDIYLRINRVNSRTFTFSYSDGSPYSLIYEDLSFIIKTNPGERLDVISLSFGAGMVVTDNQVQVAITSAQSLISEGEYYWELYNVDTQQTWINGKAFFHNGEFDGVTETTSAITIGNDDNIQITLFQPLANTVLGGGTWGDITGSLSNQTDLWDELQNRPTNSAVAADLLLKANVNTPSFTGNVTLQGYTGSETRALTVNSLGVVGTQSIRGTRISLSPSQVFNGTTSEVRLTDTIKFNAGDVIVGDSFVFGVLMGKSGTLGSYVMRIYANTADSLVGATQIARVNPSATSLYCRFERTMNVISLTSQFIYPTNTDASTDVGVFTVAPADPAINFNNDVYFIITITLVAGGDTVNIRSVKVNIN